MNLLILILLSSFVQVSALAKDGPIPLPAVESDAAALVQGKTAMQEERYKDAEQAFRLHTIQVPDDWRGFQYLGNALWAEGRKADAIACYKHCLGLKPDHDALKDLIAQVEPSLKAIQVDSSVDQPEKAESGQLGELKELGQRQPRTRALSRPSSEKADPFRASHVRMSAWGAMGFGLGSHKSSSAHINASSRGGEGFLGGIELLGGRTNIAGTDQGFEVGAMFLYLPVGIEYDYQQTFEWLSYYPGYTIPRSATETYRGALPFDLGGVVNLYYLNRFHRYWRAIAGLGAGVTYPGYSDAYVIRIQSSMLFHATGGIEFVVARSLNFGIQVDYFSTAYRLINRHDENEVVVVPIDILAPRLSLDIRF